ncbi:Os06g0563850 [Oryza sativa Japonica Group]|uniref:Os06g0563850 protein n=1 Tax=Oryza sativa subsp. japonica TaxID=39947 RepID=A0A0P0WY93_ORYSJ|nr:Os06g0563850 [Oryza sativa Japonica Group]
MHLRTISSARERLRITWLDEVCASSGGYAPPSRGVTEADVTLRHRHGELVPLVMSVHCSCHKVVLYHKVPSSRGITEADVTLRHRRVAQWRLSSDDGGIGGALTGGHREAVTLAGEYGDDAILQIRRRR